MCNLYAVRWDINQQTLYWYCLFVWIFIISRFFQCFTFPNFSADSISLETGTAVWNFNLKISKYFIEKMHLKLLSAKCLAIFSIPVNPSFLLFQIIAQRYDHFDDKDQSQYFETIYSLLDHHSPQYRSSFGDTLMGKLQQLQQQQDTTEQEQWPWARSRSVHRNSLRRTITLGKVKVST